MSTTLEHVTATEQLRFALSKLNPASSWHGTLARIIERGRTQGSLKKWIAGVDSFETLQLSVSFDPATGEPASIGSVWAPGVRVIRSVKSTYFTSGESYSRRDFAGMVTFAATADYWLGFDTDQGANRVGLVIYRRTPQDAA